VAAQRPTGTAGFRHENVAVYAKSCAKSARRIVALAGMATRELHHERGSWRWTLWGRRFWRERWHEARHRRGSGGMMELSLRVSAAFVSVRIVSYSEDRRG